MSRPVRAGLAPLALQVLLAAGLGGVARADKILVLPLDGSVDPSLRARVNAALARQARRLPGEVTIADATFSETATAVGCGSANAGCARTIVTTLGVDVLYWGTVRTANGETVVTINRVDRASGAPRTGAGTLAAAAAPEQVDGTVAGALGLPAPARPTPPPGDGGTSTAGTSGTLGTSGAGRTGGGSGAGRRRPPSGTDAGAGGDAPPAHGRASTPTGGDRVAVTGPAPPARGTGQRTKGILITSGGGLAVLIGVAMWSAQAGVQGDIDSAPTATAGDFARLEDLEGRARGYALAGNILVLGGLAAAGYGGWVLYQDHRERRAVTITPQVTPAGAGVVLGGVW